MLKLTAAQTKALKLIADNPGRVIALMRGESGYLTVNGNTETRLQGLGLVTPVKVATKTRRIGAETVEYNVCVWELTEKGRQALAGPETATERVYQVILTVRHTDGSTSRTKAVPVRAASQDRAVAALTARIAAETGKAVAETLFQKVS